MLKKTPKKSEEIKFAGMYVQGRIINVLGMCDLIFCGYLTYKLPLCKVMKGCTLKLTCFDVYAADFFDSI